MRHRIDVERAHTLKAAGMTRAEIGRLLAAEIGRRVPFRPESISHALRLARRRGSMTA